MIQSLVIPFTGAETIAYGNWPVAFASATSYRIAYSIVNNTIANGVVAFRQWVQASDHVQVECSDYFVGEVHVLGYDTSSLVGNVQAAKAAFIGSETSIAITWPVAFVGNYQIATGRATNGTFGDVAEIWPFRLTNKTSTGVTVECSEVVTGNGFDIHLLAYGVT